MNLLKNKQDLIEILIKSLPEPNNITNLDCVNAGNDKIEFNWKGDVYSVDLSGNVTQLSNQNFTYVLDGKVISQNTNQQILMQHIVKKAIYEV